MQEEYNNIIQEEPYYVGSYNQHSTSVCPTI